MEQRCKSMNTIIVNRIPPGVFEVVSILTSDGRTEFLDLVQRHKPIKYLLNEMPKIPQDIYDELDKRNYYDFVLESDKRQHFLIG